MTRHERVGRVHVMLRGSARWVALYESLLPEFSIRTVRARPMSQQRKRRAVGCHLGWWRSQLLHQLMVDARSKNTAFFFRKARERGMPVVAHWIGSDVLRLREHVAEHGVLPAFVVDDVSLHLADSPTIRDELASMNMTTEVIRLLPREIESPALPLAEVPAAMAYLPTGAESFYRVDIISALARRFSDVTFYVVANDGASLVDSPGNMVFLGEVKDLDSQYRKVDVLIRICEHDSLSAMVLEALARGRHVIYSEPFPCARHATTVDDVARHLGEIFSSRTVNVEGSEFVEREFSWRGEVEKLHKLYETLLA